MKRNDGTIELNAEACARVKASVFVCGRVDGVGWGFEIKDHSKAG